MSSSKTVIPDEVAFTDDTEGSFRQWVFAVFMPFLATKKTDMSSLIATPPRKGLANDYDAEDHADYSAQAKVWTLEQQAHVDHGVARKSQAAMFTQDQQCGGFMITAMQGSSVTLRRWML